MKFKDGTLEIQKELSELDELVLDFVQSLEDMNLNYVIVSGYVAVLTGRSRGTEDIDIIIEKMNREEIEDFAGKLLDSGYWCLNADTSEICDMLAEGIAPRFAEEGKAIPNFEINFPTDEFEKTALKERMIVKIDSSEIKISPLELQIAYKLYLGSEKDWEDALHLHRLFKENLDENKLVDFSKKLRVEEDLDELRGA